MAPKPVQTDLKLLKERIESGDYVVDAARVAEAIVQRLLDGGCIKA